MASLKLEIMLIETTIKNFTKSLKNHKVSIKMQLSLFPDMTKIINFWSKILMFAELKGCVT